MTSSSAEGWPRAVSGPRPAPGSFPGAPGDDRRDDRSDQPDDDLSRRARDGDRSAFSGLYDRFAPTVHGVLLSLVPVQEARDLVQEVFLLALRSIGGLDRPERVGAWLCTIARNRARDVYKEARARDVQWSDEIEHPESSEAAPDESPEEAGEAAEAQAALAAIRELSESYRETLVLRLVEGLTGPEIAERTGMTHGSVRVNLHRGMKLLRKKLKQGGRGCEDE